MKENKTTIATTTTTSTSTSTSSTGVSNSKGNTPPTLQTARILFAKLHLLDIAENLAQLSRTLNRHSRTIDKLGKLPTLPPNVVDKLLTTIRDRDRRFIEQLAQIRITVDKTNHLLILDDAKPSEKVPPEPWPHEISLDTPPSAA